MIAQRQTSALRQSFTLSWASRYSLPEVRLRQEAGTLRQPLSCARPRRFTLAGNRQFPFDAVLVRALPDEKLQFKLIRTFSQTTRWEELPKNRHFAMPHHDVLLCLTWGDRFGKVVDFHSQQNELTSTTASSVRQDDEISLDRPARPRRRHAKFKPEFKEDLLSMFRQYKSIKSCKAVNDIGRQTRLCEVGLKEDQRNRVFLVEIDLCPSFMNSEAGLNCLNSIVGEQENTLVLVSEASSIELQSLAKAGPASQAIIVAHGDKSVCFNSRWVQLKASCSYDRSALVKCLLKLVYLYSGRIGLLLSCYSKSSPYLKGVGQVQGVCQPGSRCLLVEAVKPEDVQFLLLRLGDQSDLF